VSISKGFLVDIDVTDPAPPDSAFRRRLLGIGLGGAAVSLLPWLVGRASATTTTSATSDTTPATTTTVPPKRPSDADVELLGFAQTVEIAAFRLYEEALGTAEFSEEERAVIATFHDAHQAYAQSLSGFLGRDAPQVLNPIYDEMLEAFSGDRASVLTAAYDLESVAVATHTDILGQLQGTDGAALIASILIVEGAHGTVLADIAGETDLDILLVKTEADALAPVGG
jgi:Ferritin-like domain